MMDSTASLTRPEHDRSTLSKLSNGSKFPVRTGINKPGKPAGKKYSMADFEKLAVLGRGNFGEVRLVRL